MLLNQALYISAPAQRTAPANAADHCLVDIAGAVKKQKKRLHPEKNKDAAFFVELLENMNAGAALLGVKFDIREEYAIEYLEGILKKYIELVGFDPGKAVHGKGNHKTSEQRFIEKFSEYIERLKKYAERIKICGNDRSSYSKTDHDATFMRTTAKNTAWKNS